MITLRDTSFLCRPLAGAAGSAPRRVAQAGLGRLTKVALGALVWVIAYPLLVSAAVVGVLAVTVLAAASVEIHEAVIEVEGVAFMDRPALALAAEARTPWLNTAVTAFTDLGDKVPLAVLAVGAAAGLAWWLRRWTPVVLMAVACTGSVLVTVVGKTVVGRMRPPLNEAVPPYSTSGSFPSGHTLNTLVVAGVLAYLLVVLVQRRWPVRLATVGVAAGVAVAMAGSRVFLGHHWLTDVLVSWTLGLAWLAVIVGGHQAYLALRWLRADDDERPLTMPLSGR